MKHCTMIFFYTLFLQIFSGTPITEILSYHSWPMSPDLNFRGLFQGPPPGDKAPMWKNPIRNAAAQKKIPYSPQKKY